MLKKGMTIILLRLNYFSSIDQDKNISLDFIPVVPKQFLSYRIALYTEIFGDAGAVRLRGNSISYQRFYFRFGFGLTLLYTSI